MCLLRRKRRDGKMRAETERDETSDDEVTLCCTHPVCVLVTVDKAGLTNHTHQTHMLPLKSKCQFCKQLFYQQGTGSLQSLKTLQQVMTFNITSWHAPLQPRVASGVHTAYGWMVWSTYTDLTIPLVSHT